MFSFNHLKKNLKKDKTGLKPVKLSIVAEDSNQLFITALKGYAIELGYDLQVNDCGYNELDLQVLNLNPN